MPDSRVSSDEQHGEEHQQAAEIHRERIVDQHAGEEFVPNDVAIDQQCGRLRPRQGKPQPDERTGQRDEERVDSIAATEHAHQQHQHDRRAEHQLGAKRRQADRRRMRRAATSCERLEADSSRIIAGWLSVFRYKSNSIVAGFARIQPRLARLGILANSATVPAPFKQLRFILVLNDDSWCHQHR